MTPRLRTTPAMRTVVWVTTVLATMLACSDSTTPTIPSNLVGRYVVTAVNGKRLPRRRER